MQISKKCLICGKKFEVIPCRKNMAKYCSYKCYRLIQKGRTTWNKGKKCEYSTGKNNYRWKGGQYNNLGYIFILSPNHPHANKGGYVQKHRIVAEKILGRYLTKQEIIHHINGIRNDNRPENLYLFSFTEKHTKYHRLLKKNKIKLILKSNLKRT